MNEQKRIEAAIAYGGLVCLNHGIVGGASHAQALMREGKTEEASSVIGDVLLGEYRLRSLLAADDVQSLIMEHSTADMLEKITELASRVLSRDGMIRQLAELIASGDDMGLGSSAHLLDSTADTLEKIEIDLATAN